MISNFSLGAIRIIVTIVLAAGIGATAQPPERTEYRGVINDYTPASVSGPWEVRGSWSLRVKGDSGTADFSAALTMERSDAGIMQSGNGNLNDPMQRKAHTHHITLVDGATTPILNNPNGFRVTGAATITANGDFPPPFGPNASLQIDITGGNTVEFSNITVTFIGDGPVGHFGANPLHGVVSVAPKPNER